MKSIAVTEFKAHCLALLENIARTREPLLITKRGKPLARILPSIDAKALYPQDSLAGTVTIHGDVLEPVLATSAFDAMRGDLLPQRTEPTKKRRRRT